MARKNLVKTPMYSILLRKKKHLLQEEQSLTGTLCKTLRFSVFARGFLHFPREKILLRTGTSWSEFFFTVAPSSHRACLVSVSFFVILGYNFPVAPFFSAR